MKKFHSIRNSLSLNYSNYQEFQGLHKEIFQQHCYYTQLSTPTPVILDIGAHIGLATLYFKQQYPAAQVTAVEPLPQNLKLLQQNLEQNHFYDVTIVPKAVSAVEGPLTIYFDDSPDHWWSVAGSIRGSWARTQVSSSLQVESLSLSQLLTRPVDLLKLDIEGAETEVLRAAIPYLHQIGEIFVEYHPVEGNYLQELTTLLKQSGFTIKIYHQGVLHQPPYPRNKLLLIEARR